MGTAADHLSCDLHSLVFIVFILYVGCQTPPTAVDYPMPPSNSYCIPPIVQRWGVIFGPLCDEFTLGAVKLSFFQNGKRVMNTLKESHKGWLADSQAGRQYERLFRTLYDLLWPVVPNLPESPYYETRYEKFTVTCEEVITALRGLGPLTLEERGVKRKADELSF